MEVGDAPGGEDAGRALVRLRKTQPGACAWPSCPVTWDEGRPDKRFCSKKHAMRASRARRRQRGQHLLPVLHLPPDLERCTAEVQRRLEKCMEEATERMRQCSTAAIEDFRRCVQQSATREMAGAGRSMN